MPFIQIIPTSSLSVYIIVKITQWTPVFHKYKIKSNDSISRRKNEKTLAIWKIFKQPFIDNTIVYKNNPLVLHIYWIIFSVTFKKSHSLKKNRILKQSKWGWWTDLLLKKLFQDLQNDWWVKIIFSTTTCVGYNFVRKDHSIRWIMLRHCWQFCCKSPPLCRTVFKPTSSLNQLGLGPSGVYLTIVSTVSSRDRSAQVNVTDVKKKNNYGKII